MSVNAENNWANKATEQELKNLVLNNNNYNYTQLIKQITSTE